MKKLYKLFFLFPLYILCFCDRCFADLVLPDDMYRDTYFDDKSLVELSAMWFGMRLIWGVAIAASIAVLVFFVKSIKNSVSVLITRGDVKDKKKGRRKNAK